MKHCIDYDRSHVYQGNVNKAYENGAILLVKDKVRPFIERVPQNRFENRISKLLQKGVEFKIIKQNWTLF
jgi:hypothetical protein